MKYQKNQIFMILEEDNTEACNKWRVLLHGLVPGQHSLEETSQLWRAVGNLVSNFLWVDFVSKISNYIEAASRSLKPVRAGHNFKIALLYVLLR